MKKLITITLLLYSFLAFSQEEINKNVLEADSTWYKEVIKFPLGFAREIKYSGYEELRFAPGFAKEESSELWSYAWAWVIDDRNNITVEELEVNLQYYFDGLLNLNPEHNKNKPQQTLAVLVKNKAKNNLLEYNGKLKTTDTRYTNTEITLNIHGEQHYCKARNKTIVVFRLSPQTFENKIWTDLKQIKLKENICDF